VPSTAPCPAHRPGARPPGPRPSPGLPGSWAAGDRALPTGRGRGFPWPHRRRAHGAGSRPARRDRQPDGGRREHRHGGRGASRPRRPYLAAERRAHRGEPLPLRRAAVRRGTRFHAGRHAGGGAQHHGRADRPAGGQRGGVRRAGPRAPDELRLDRQRHFAPPGRRAIQHRDRAGPDPCAVPGNRCRQHRPDGGPGARHVPDHLRRGGTGARWADEGARRDQRRTRVRLRRGPDAARGGRRSRFGRLVRAPLAARRGGRPRRAAGEGGDRGGAGRGRGRADGRQRDSPAPHGECGLRRLHQSGNAALGRTRARRGHPRGM
ncbi:MAG: BUG/TctC family periplasmic protein, partial [uncultured Acetobacteraceae bacterium]